MHISHGCLRISRCRGTHCMPLSYLTLLSSVLTLPPISLRQPLLPIFILSPLRILQLLFIIIITIITILPYCIAITTIYVIIRTQSFITTTTSTITTITIITIIYAMSCGAHDNPDTLTHGFPQTSPLEQTAFSFQRFKTALIEREISGHHSKPNWKILFYLISLFFNHQHLGFFPLHIFSRSLESFTSASYSWSIIRSIRVR